jgi:hypothetical protein
MRRRFTVGYGLVVASGLAVLASLGDWAGFWVSAFVAVWFGIWLAFSAFWRWADETRRTLLRRRGYY